MSAFAAQRRDAREPACTARYGMRIAQSAPPEFRVRAQRRWDPLAVRRAREAYRTHSP